MKGLMGAAQTTCRAPLRLLLIDDAPIVRSGMREMLGRSAEFEVVGEASSSAEAIAVALELLPDVVVTEMRLEGKAATDAIRELRRRLPSVRILIFTSMPDVQLAVDAIVAGADGYLLKRASGDTLAQAIKTVGRAEAFADPWMASRIFEMLRRRSWEWTPNPTLPVTARENRMLVLVAAGKSNREIASELQLAEQTVKNQLSQLLHRLGIPRRVLVTRYLAEASSPLA